MRGFFEPETVAVVGVSNSPDNLGRKISINLQAFGFEGIVYEVGPRAAPSTAAASTAPWRTSPTTSTWRSS